MINIHNTMQTVHASPASAAFALSTAVSPAFSVLVDQARPAVVQVRSQAGGAGTGVIWASNGMVITNDHVVAHARGSLELTLTDGRSFPARLAARNPRLDLAVLRIEAYGLPAATLGDSRSLRVGELVLAIGHPWGQPWVVTAGIVSALGDVPIGDGSSTATYIRSDVRLAPGNSGGPLLNARGEVIGINAMIFGGDLAVAIPAHVASDWLNLQPRERPGLGVQVRRVDLPEGVWAGRTYGLLVVGLYDHSPAAMAGLLVGDLLIDVGGAALESPAALRMALEQHRTGALQFTLLRAGSTHQYAVPLDQ